MTTATTPAEGSGAALVRVADAAEILQCHPQTVRKLLALGQLQRVDVGGHSEGFTSESIVTAVTRDAAWSPTLP